MIIGFQNDSPFEVAWNNLKQLLSIALQPGISINDFLSAFVLALFYFNFQNIQFLLEIITVVICTFSGLTIVFFVLNNQMSNKEPFCFWPL
jgi:hypothetical protein